MISPDEARRFIAQWRPQFRDPAHFDASWDKFLDMTGDPTIAKAVTWITKDAAKEQLRVVPTGDNPASTFRAGHCSHCRGVGVVHVLDEAARKVSQPGTPGFGQARACPACNRPDLTRCQCARCAGHDPATCDCLVRLY